jgi:hypothetical protein
LAPPPVFRKYGPEKVLSGFPEGMPPSESGLQDMLESISRSNFKIFDNVRIELCMDLKPIGGSLNSISVEAIIFANQSRFVSLRRAQPIDMHDL